MREALFYDGMEIFPQVGGDTLRQHGFNPMSVHWPNWVRYRAETHPNMIVPVEDSDGETYRVPYGELQIVIVEMYAVNRIAFRRPHPRADRFKY